MKLNLDYPTFSKPKNQTSDNMVKIGAQSSAKQTRADTSSYCLCVCHWQKKAFCEVCKLNHFNEYKQLDLFGKPLNKIESTYTLAHSLKNHKVKLYKKCSHGNCNERVTNKPHKKHCCDHLLDFYQANKTLDDFAKIEVLAK